MESQTKNYQENKIIKQAIFTGKELKKNSFKLEGISSGIKGLDELFFTIDFENGKPTKKPLNGIPKYGVFNITGAPDTGKSLMVEQFAVKQASKGKKVIFVTVESPAFFVIGGLKQRAMAMGIKFEDIENNLIVVDAASYSRLREIPNLLGTLAYIIKKYQTEFVIIDSITGLYENKEMMARSIVRRIFNFLKKWYQTSLLVSQKRSGHEDLSAEAAGGFAVGHILDGTFVLTKELILTTYQAKIFGKEIGDIVRLFRIDGCRLAGHDTKVHYLYITDLGLVEIGPTLNKK